MATLAERLGCHAIAANGRSRALGVARLAAFWNRHGRPIIKRSRRHRLSFPLWKTARGHPRTPRCAVQLA
jgi:hypothetical protein